jgi:hypothetical protein
MVVTKLVIWDVDKVWYPDLGTTYASMGSRGDGRKFVEEGLANNWYTQENIDAWQAYRTVQGKNNDLGSIHNVATMYTDFFKTPESTGEGKTIFTKTETIQRKQALLKGLTMADVRAVADGYVLPNLTPGLKEAVAEFRAMGLHQAAISDGLAPLIYYVTSQPTTRMDYAWATPAFVDVNGRREEFQRHWISRNDVVLLGETPENSSKNPRALMRAGEYGFDKTAAIDDSAANINGQLKPIQDRGGMAVGFYPLKHDYEKFEAAGIPILNGGSPDLRPFIEIVKDPRKINEYCQTWGKKF